MARALRLVLLLGNQVLTAAARAPALGSSSDPLSAVATLVLRGLLAECGGVAVSVRGAHKLPAGAVDGVRIEGRRWRSPGGLRCRELAMDVGKARVDAGRLFASRQIAFVEPALGEAEVIFDAADFAAFLAHPLVGPTARWPPAGTVLGAQAPRPEPPPFTFASGACAIDERGVALRGDWRGARRKMLLAPSSAAGGSRAPVSVRPVRVPQPSRGAAGADEAVGDESDELARLLTSWFACLHVDLDGALVGPIRELQLLGAGVPPSGAARPSAVAQLARTHAGSAVRLRMGLSVRRFPALPPKF
ncbi:hypothetical protein KFE25_009862 [Diacronema lutheri]|uniref:Uncharacterized protein n=1 Tax=Diacronema lutheri TaxID=2081491 RepID=A0A8J6BZK6_DIALT|nr:hypothetical protein KFE25_009862 [Diacronema lutheri]